MERQQYVWQGFYYRTMEFVSVEAVGTGYLIKGSIAGETNSKPLDMRYQIKTDTCWATQQVSVWIDSDPIYTLAISKSNLGECTDVDISMSPFTNTLTINREKLPIGASAENTVRYIDIENRQHKPVRQRYTRVDADWYRYENLESGFVSMVRVDADGIVIHYPGIWERIYP